MKLTVLKLGGSLITDKSKPYTHLPEVISRLVSEIKEAVAENPELNLILMNGGGSYPHTSAAKYGTRDGFEGDKGRYGLCVVAHDAARINRILVKEMLNQGLPAFSLQPSAFMLAKAGELEYLNMSSMRELLKHKAIPVLYGDVVLDIAQGSTIFGADKLAEIVAKGLFERATDDRIEVAEIINAGNYAGVEDPNGKLIPEITPSKMVEIESVFYESETQGVTGGMKQKVLEFLKLTEIEVDSWIIDGSVADNLREKLEGKTVVGTRITKDAS